MKMVILDAVMGTGKSTYIIEKINSSPSKKYIILVPLLSEVTRYKEALSLPIAKGGKRPDIMALDTDESQSKTERFLNAVRDGMTVVTTHELFARLSSWDMSSISLDEYELIIDETIALVEKGILRDVDIKSAEDLKLIKKSDHSSIEGLQIYQLLPSAEGHIGQGGALSEVLKAVQGKHIYSVGAESVVFVVPPEKFKTFKSVTLLTYLFKGSETNAWLEVFAIPFDHLELYREAGGFKTRPHLGVYEGKRFSSLLDIYEGPYNDVGMKVPRSRRYPLGKHWYDDQAKKKGKAKIKDVQKSTRSFFRNHSKGREDNLWTCFKGHRESIRDNHFSRKGTGEYPEGFLVLNTRATNDFADRHTLAYLVNVNPFPEIEQFFRKQGASFDRDNYALSMVLQWVWRSAIRNGEPIKLYLPSERMRALILDWFKDALLKVLAK